ncbi:MAG TPA: aquaporin [Ktedonobacterales bacterium]|nr:aquaporin [Ktedonobacterales bacterium]
MSSRKAPPRNRHGTESESSPPIPPASNASTQPTTPEPTSTALQRVVAELLGTLLLVLFHGGAAASLNMIESGNSTIPGIAFLALVDGFSLFAIIMIIGKISGVLINPAVTIGLAIQGRFPLREVPSYLAAQFLGATLGTLIIIAAMGHDALTIGRLGAVQLSPGVSIWQGLLIEALGTFFLVLTISATAEDPRSPSGWAAFAIGMSLTAIVLLFEPFTGAPVNPARAFGPNLVDFLFNVPVEWGVYLLCYLLGPLIGASIATTLYRYLANQPRHKPAPEPD